ncbi:hypothetical protein HY484_02020, partial [Candidatus Woesearchaeota archaeon]|nr:hypothetical protein [Candidatus Woesearchaeota archaeon]
MNKKLYSVIMVYLIIVAVFPVSVVGTAESNIAGEVPEEPSEEDKLKEKIKSEPERLTADELNKYLESNADKSIIPWGRIDQSIVSEKYVADIPPEKVDVNEVKFSDKLIADQLKFGDNLDRLSAPPKLFLLNKVELAKAIQDKVQFAKNLDLGGLTAGAAFDTSSGKLFNGKSSLVLTSLPDYVTGVVAESDGTLRLLGSEGKNAHVKSGDLKFSDGIFYVASNDVSITSKGIDVSIKKGDDRIDIKHDGFYEDKNSKVKGKKAFGTVGDDYFDGEFEKDGNEIYLRNGIVINLKTGVGTKGGDIKIHNDQVFAGSRFVPAEQKKQNLEKAMTAIRESAEPPKFSGEVWIKGTSSENVQVYAKGNVDVRFYDTTTKQQKNDFVFTSIDPAGNLDLQRNGAEFEFDAKGKVSVLKGQQYSSVAGTIDVTAVSYDGKQSEAILTYSNKNGDDALAVNCNGCKEIGEVAVIKRGFPQNVKGVVKEEQIEFVMSLEEKDGQKFMRALPNVASLQRIASRQTEDSYAVISQDFSLNAGGLNLVINKNGDVKAVFGDEEQKYFSFSNARKELGDEPAVFVAATHPLAKAEMDAHSNVKEQETIVSDIGQKIRENKALITEFERTIKEAQQAITELSVEKANSFFGLSSEAEDVLRGLQLAVSNAQKDLNAERAKSAELVVSARRATDDVQNNYRKVIEELQALKTQQPAAADVIDKQIRELQGTALMQGLQLAAKSDDYERVHQFAAGLRSNHPEHKSVASFFEGIANLNEAGESKDADAKIKTGYLQLQEAVKNPAFKKQVDALLQKLDEQLFNNIEEALRPEVIKTKSELDNKFSLWNRFNPFIAGRILGGIVTGDNPAIDKAVASEIMDLSQQERGIKLIRMLRKQGKTLEEIEQI